MEKREFESRSDERPAIRNNRELNLDRIEMEKKKNSNPVESSL